MSELVRLVEARTRMSGSPESPPETRMLRLLRKAGLPAPVCQFEVVEGGRFVARVDFAYPDIRLAIEVDSYRSHSGRLQWQRDLHRRNRLTALGWGVVHVTAADLDRRPTQVVQMIAEARNRLL